MARKVLNKINGKLKFLHRQVTFLNPTCKILLSNTLIQPHFDYGCTSWYPFLSKVFKKGFRLLKISVWYCVDPPHALTSLLYTLEKLTGSLKSSEWNFVRQLQSLNIGINWHHPISTIYSHLLLIDTTMSHRWHWIYLFKKRKRSKKYSVPWT